VRQSLGVALAALLAAATALAEESPISERRFDLPDGSEVAIRVPTDWNAQVHQARRRRAPTLIFTPTAGPAFRFLLSPIWSPKQDQAYRSSAEDRAFVAQAAARAKGRSVEEELPVIEFQGTSGPGYYYSATDRLLEPEGFRYTTEGVVRIGAVSVSFTILTNEREGIVDQALGAIKSAEPFDGEEDGSETP